MTHNSTEIKNLQTWCKENLLTKAGLINGNKLRKDYKFYNENIETFNKIDSYLDENMSGLKQGERITCFTKNIFVNPLCYCDKPTSYNKTERNFSTYCSHDCARKCPKVRSKVSDSIKNISKEYREEINKKTKETRLKVDENGMNSYDRMVAKVVPQLVNKSKEEKEQIKLKRQNTRFRLYGDRNYNNKDKFKSTMLERYGVEYSMQNKEILQKSKDKHSSKSDKEKAEIIMKMKETLLEKYGVDSFSKTKEFLDKTSKTLLEKYGVDNYFKSDEFNDKSKATKLKKYGDKYYNNFTKSIETKIQRGIITPRENKDDYKHYRELVDYYTRKNYYKYYDNINPNNYKRGLTKYHLDHKVSVREGFKNNTPLHIIAHPCNLEILWYKDNLVKGVNCSITIDKLFEDINDFNK